MVNAMDVLMGYTQVERRGNECRIVAYDRHGVQTIYADWCEPVRLEEPSPPEKRKWWWKKAVDK